MNNIGWVLALLVVTCGAAYDVMAAQDDITLEQARAIALKAAPGTIAKQEREQEGGHERYSFDIRQGHRIHEIGIDVRTGRIVEDKFEPLNARD